MAVVFPTTSAFQWTVERNATSIMEVNVIRINFTFIRQQKIMLSTFQQLSELMNQHQGKELYVVGYRQNNEFYLYQGRNNGFIDLPNIGQLAPSLIVLLENMNLLCPDRLSNFIEKDCFRIVSKNSGVGEGRIAA